MIRRLGTFFLCFVLLATSIISISSMSSAQDSTPAPAAVPVGDQLFTAEGVSAPILATAPLSDPALAGGTLVLEQLQLAPGTELSMRTAIGPEILYVLEGDLTIEDDFGFGTTIQAGNELILNAGTGYIAANSGTAALSVLRVGIDGGGATPQADLVEGEPGVTTLLSLPLDAVAESGGQIVLAQATFGAGSTSGEQAHGGPIGLFVTEGTLRVTSPSGLEGDLEAGRNVTLPATTPLQASTETGATVFIIGVDLSGAGLMAEVTPEPTAEPTAEPTVEQEPTAEPEPTEVPEAPPILFEAGNGTPFGAWATGNGWMPVDNMVVSDGQMCSYAVAPVDLSAVRDYAIEAEIQIVSLRYDAAFGVFGRWNGDSRYVAGVRSDSNNEPVGYAAISYVTQDHELNRNDFRSAFYGNSMSRTELSFDGDWHTYRFELRGNEQRLYIDGAEVVRSADNRLVAGGDAGLWCHYGGQISVRSFTITSLMGNADTVDPATSTVPQSDTSEGSESLSSASVYSGELGALLPTEAEVPEHLVFIADRDRTLDQVAQNYVSPPQTTALFQEWGWQGNVTRAFNMPDGVPQPPGEVEGVYVSIHAFSTPGNARAALDFSLDEQMMGTSLYEIPVAPIGDYARALYGPVSYGTEITYLVQKDNLLIRASASSRDGDPTPGGDMVILAIMSRFD